VASRQGSIHVRDRVSDVVPLRGSGQGALLDLDAILSPDGEPVHDVGTVVAVETIARTSNPYRDVRTDSLDDRAYDVRLQVARRHPAADENNGIFPVRIIRETVECDGVPEPPGKHRIEPGKASGMDVSGGDVPYLRGIGGARLRSVAFAQPEAHRLAGQLVCDARRLIVGVVFDPTTVGREHDQTSLGLVVIAEPLDELAVQRGIMVIYGRI
jgi:hypothetical protein